MFTKHPGNQTVIASADMGLCNCKEDETTLALGGMTAILAREPEGTQKVEVGAMRTPGPSLSLTWAPDMLQR